MPLRLLLAVFIATAFLPVAAQTASPATVSSLLTGLTTANQPPFTFTYNGREASAVLPGWKKREADVTSSTGNSVRRITYLDPATKLKVTVEIRKFTDFPAVDWVLYFTNEGAADTPILENLLPLRTTLICDSTEAHLHSAAGSCQSREDFHLTDTLIPAGQPFGFGTATGRSSDGLNSPNGNVSSFPFFNVQTGDHGTIVAIGWTGNWMVNINRATDGKTIALNAGMLKTHLLLHPGETIRTPRILMMDWKGNINDGQNAWRKLMLAHYSPRDPGGAVVKMPATWGSWGTERASHKVDIVKKIQKDGVPADVYWIDAGWYEPLSLPPGVDTVGNSDWANHRGNWVPSHDLYPVGMRPIGEACKAAGIGFLVWVESETANADAPWVKAHPDWYFKPPGHEPNADWPYFLNLGNPAAYEALLNEMTRFISDGELTWYRQDFNFTPAPYWAAADSPDRVGISEIKSIMGLYAYWDALRAQHPGLQIDNCSSGGRRIDIETISRAVELWRSDAAGEPMGEQFHTEGLLPWVPLNSAVWLSPAPDAIGKPDALYAQRCGYSAGFTTGADLPSPQIKKSYEEFHEVQPYFYADYYPLQPQRDDLSLWSAWQLDRPDHGDGLILCLRRPNSIYSTLQLDVQHVDPAATYEVEVRTSMDHAPRAEVSGADLAHFQVTVSDKPGSALVFYHKK